MFAPICIPYGAKMLFNIAKLKPGYTIEDVELALGEMCNVVKNTYGDEQGGFIAGQVFKFDGFISDEGSFTDEQSPEATAACAQNSGEHIAIVTYWSSFEQHELSHADNVFKEKFEAVKQYCEELTELGYTMLWQGVPEDDDSESTA